MEVEFLSNMRYSLFASGGQWWEWQEKLRRFRVHCDSAQKAPLPQLSPETDSVRYGGNGDEPGVERVTRPATTGLEHFPSRIPPLGQDSPRLPVPSLAISTSQPINSSYDGATTVSQNISLLPPLRGLAMSVVYPSVPAYTPQLPMPTPTGPPSQYGSHGTSVSGDVTSPHQQSPHSVQDLPPLGPSPISAYFPIQNSPSIYLQQRTSPFKPVRHMNTLLHPTSIYFDARSHGKYGLDSVELRVRNKRMRIG
jgi:hypothetical protein